MPDQLARISRVIEEFDAQGWHRTGTEVDVASGKWLASQAEEIGLQTDLESYDLSRIVVEQGTLQTLDRSINGLPIFDGEFTDSAGIKGRLGPAGSEAQIGMLVLEGNVADTSAEELRRGSRHSALVAVTVGGRPGLMAHNATDFNHPFGIPVLQVSGEERAFLEDAAAKGAEATVVANVRRVPSQSQNVVARWPGSRPELAPVCLTTPRSGWWHCASERGGGIAAWLEVARMIVEAAPPRPIWFVAFSGHELGHLGSDAFLEAREGVAKEAIAWVHLGANVGGAAEPSVRLSASDAALLEMGRRELTGAGVGKINASPAGAILGLESAELHRHGGRVLALLGSNAHFHLLSDRWPQAVDPESIAVQVSAVTKLILALAERD